MQSTHSQGTTPHTNPPLSNRHMIYHILTCIPTGTVAYYGQLSDILRREGRMLTPQIVGFILTSMNDHDMELYPWWRVVGKSGDIATLKLGLKGTYQIELLAREGIAIIDNHIDMHKYCVDTDILYSYVCGTPNI